MKTKSLFKILISVWACSARGLAILPPEGLSLIQSSMCTKTPTYPQSIDCEKKDKLLLFIVRAVDAVLALLRMHNTGQLMMYMGFSLFGLSISLVRKDYPIFCTIISVILSILLFVYPIAGFELTSIQLITTISIQTITCFLHYFAFTNTSNLISAIISILYATSKKSAIQAMFIVLEVLIIYGLPPWKLTEEANRFIPNSQAKTGRYGSTSQEKGGKGGGKGHANPEVLPEIQSLAPAGGEVLHQGEPGAPIPSTSASLLQPQPQQEKTIEPYDHELSEEEIEFCKECIIGRHGEKDTSSDLQQIESLLKEVKFVQVEKGTDLYKNLPSFDTHNIDYIQGCTIISDSAEYAWIALHILLRRTMPNEQNVIKCPVINPGTKTICNGAAYQMTHEEKGPTTIRLYLVAMFYPALAKKYKPVMPPSLVASLDLKFNMRREVFNECMHCITEDPITKRAIRFKLDDYYKCLNSECISNKDRTNMSHIAIVCKNIKFDYLIVPVTKLSSNVKEKYVPVLKNMVTGNHPKEYTADQKKFKRLCEILLLADRIDQTIDLKGFVDSFVESINNQDENSLGEGDLLRDHALSLQESLEKLISGASSDKEALRLSKQITQGIEDFINCVHEKYLPEDLKGLVECTNENYIFKDDFLILTMWEVFDFMKKNPKKILRGRFKGGNSHSAPHWQLVDSDKGSFYFGAEPEEVGGGYIFRHKEIQEYCKRYFAQNMKVLMNLLFLSL